MNGRMHLLFDNLTELCICSICSVPKLKAKKPHGIAAVFLPGLCTLVNNRDSLPRKSCLWYTYIVPISVAKFTEALRRRVFHSTYPDLILLKLNAKVDDMVAVSSVKQYRILYSTVFSKTKRQDAAAIFYPQNTFRNVFPRPLQPPPIPSPLVHPVLLLPRACRAITRSHPVLPLPPWIHPPPLAPNHFLRNLKFS
jgi:hypothetical protein